MNKYDDKYTKCPACDSENIKYFHADFRGNTIYKCEQCKVQFMNPVYSDEYLDYYYSQYIDINRDVDTVLQDKYDLIVNDNFNAIEQVVKNKGNMLDFGIGNGDHAKLAIKKGWQVSGYDVDCKATESLMQRTGIEIKCGNFFDLNWGEVKFDLIYANQVAEHLKDPVAYIKYFKSLLSDKGCLFIAVPNIHSTSIKLKFLLEKLKLRKNKTGKYYDAEHHIFYYDPTSLKNILENNGYEVVISRNCAKPKVERSRLWLFLSNHVFEKFYSTSTFMIVARKS